MHSVDTRFPLVKLSLCDIVTACGFDVDTSIDLIDQVLNHLQNDEQTIVASISFACDSLKKGRARGEQYPGEHLSRPPPAPPAQPRALSALMSFANIF
ncbi:hypothetical protein EVAR_88149_1 [Eumeta japonica]|uniref:Uncharacterized protein n=1 Tax=Eumeta variegata TaxID=151549 RepID=A0A4C1WT46_EUMVA|nr:hypothetical protein EVAR_88149_1 [Eumeta japonica]